MFSNFGTSKKPKPSQYYLSNRISIFFSVFKMIGREHQASLNLPSFGFSKVHITFIQGSGLGSHPNTLESSLASPPKKNSCISGLCSNLVTGATIDAVEEALFHAIFCINAMLGKHQLSMQCACPENQRRKRFIMNIMSAQIVFNFPPLTPIGMNGSKSEKNNQPILSLEYFGCYCYFH